VNTAPPLRAGQRVRAHSKRWTPHGWEPVEQDAIVIDPCVENDPDYAGDVEIEIEGELSRTFVPRASIVPVDEEPETAGRPPRHPERVTTLREAVATFVAGQDRVRVRDIATHLDAISFPLGGSLAIARTLIDLGWSGIKRTDGVEYLAPPPTLSSAAPAGTAPEPLKPCPFCGGAACRVTIGDEEPNNAGGDVIVCTRCNASSHVEFGRKENLVARWNGRATASIVEVLERAVRALEPFARTAAWRVFFRPSKADFDLARQVWGELRQAAAKARDGQPE
jgi:Lar family restriction alleviation protein